MSHIHLPDGVLPVWLWGFGFFIVFLYISNRIKSYNVEYINKKIPLVSFIAALMLISMSIHIIPPFYHINLGALSGIILGPVLAPISIFTVNLILAFLGHGGFTVIGLNTIVVSVEAIIAYYLFKILIKYFKNYFFTTFVATFIALFLSMWVSVGIVYTGTQNLNHFIEHHHENGLETHQEQAEENINFDIKKFIILLMTFGLLGWFIESLITSFIINYVNKIKPDILAIKNENK